MRRLIGVGVGPGDPELVTVKAIRVLRQADVVAVPVLAAPGAGPPGRDAAAAAPPGRAEAIIREYVDASRIRRVPFALNDSGGLTPRRQAAWDAAASAVARAFTGGAATIAFGTIGDPSLYSTFSYLAHTVRTMVRDVFVGTVPGITAMQDLAARSAAMPGGGTALAEGAEPLTLLPLTAGADALRDALARHGTVVGYKLGSASGPTPGEIAGLLAGAGRLEGAVVGSQLGLAGQDVAAAAALADLGAVPYLSTLIVPARRDGRGSGLRRGAGSAP